MVDVRRGSRHPVSPWHSEPLRARRFDWMPADLGINPPSLLGRRLRVRDDRDVGSAFGLGVERHLSVHAGEECVILADADVEPGMPLGAALAGKNIAGECQLASVEFQAEAAACRVAPVARRTACLLVRHGRSQLPLCGLTLAGKPSVARSWLARRSTSPLDALSRRRSTPTS